MLYVLHGENIYESKKKLDSFKKKFKNKYSKGKIYLINEEIPKEKINISSYSLFKEKKLYIFKRFINFDTILQKKLIRYFKKKCEFDIIIWEDRKIDKRTKIFKTLKKLGKITEYKFLSKYKLLNWVKTKTKDLQIKLSFDQTEIILSKFAPNQALIENELLKLKYIQKANSKSQISENDFKIISKGDTFDIWEFLEKLFFKKKEKALEYVNNLRSQDKKEFMLIGSIASHLRIMYLVKKYGQNKDKTISKTLSVHPYTTKKCILYSKKFTLKRIKILYSQLANLDFSLKQSKIEPKIALSLLILSL